MFDSHDQLFQVMQQLPSVDKYDLSFIACDEAKEYVLMLQNKDVESVLKRDRQIP